MEMIKAKNEFRVKILNILKKYVAMFLIIIFGLYAAKEKLDNTITMIIVSAIVSIALGKSIQKFMIKK